MGRARHHEPAGPHAQDARRTHRLHQRSARTTPRPVWQRRPGSIPGASRPARGGAEAAGQELRVSSLPGRRTRLFLLRQAGLSATAGDGWLAKGLRVLRQTSARLIRGTDSAVTTALKEGTRPMRQSHATTGTPSRPAHPLSGQGLAYRLTEEIERLRSELDHTSGGRAAK